MIQLSSLRLGARALLPRSARPARLILVAASFASALALVPVANATTTPYWGYNFMLTSTRACPSTDYGSACSGFNNWDYSEADINSGANLYIGFQACTGCLIQAAFYSTTGVHTIIWSAFAGMPHYNRVACRWAGTSTYTQCRKVIYP
jgi:hypothetical protein